MTARARQMRTRFHQYQLRVSGRESTWCSRSLQGNSTACLKVTARTQGHGSEQVGVLWKHRVDDLEGAGPRTKRHVDPFENAPGRPGAASPHHSGGSLACVLMAQLVCHSNSGKVRVHEYKHKHKKRTAKRKPSNERREQKRKQYLARV